MNNADQLQWEARLGRPAAVAAFAAGVLVLAGQVVFQMIFEDRPGLEVLPEFLVSVDENPGTLIASRAIQAVAALCLIVVFYYLFRAIRHRNPDLPAWFVYLVVIGPACYAIAQVLGALNQIDIATEFVDGEPIRGEAGDERADQVSEDGQDVPTAVFGLLGSVLVAFLFVMLPLRARRVGLMSPFMGILGVIAGDPARAPAAPRRARDHPGLLAGRARAAVPGQLAGRPRPGLGDGRGGALAVAPAAPRPGRDRRRGRQRGRRQRRGAGRARGGARGRARATQLPQAQAQALRRAAPAALAAAGLLSGTPAAAQPAPALELRAPRVVATGAAVDLRGAGAQPRERVRFEIRLRGGRWARLAATRADARGRFRGRVRPRRARRLLVLRARGALAVSRPRRVRTRAVTLAAVGDINLGNGPGAVMALRGLRFPWTGTAGMLRRADVAFGNLECAVSVRGFPVPKEFNFRGPPAALRPMARYAGFDVLNLANNHVGDYGTAALLDTVKNVRRFGMTRGGRRRQPGQRGDARAWWSGSGCASPSWASRTSCPRRSSPARGEPARSPPPRS